MGGLRRRHAADAGPLAILISARANRRTQAWERQDVRSYRSNDLNAVGRQSFEGPCQRLTREVAGAQRPNGPAIYLGEVGRSPRDRDAKRRGEFSPNPEMTRPAARGFVAGPGRGWS